MRRGWLANPERRKRRDRAHTFTDKDALYLIEKIDEEPHYISETLTRARPELDGLIRLRDRALVATAWTWFKRGGEVLRLKRKDVAVTDREILVTFHVSKKQKRFKVCPGCNEKNGFRSKFCRRCSRNLTDVEVSVEGGPQIVTKRKTLRHRFAKYILEWLQKFDGLTEDGEAWLFPALRVVFSHAFFDFKSERHMTVQNFDRILKRLDPNMTSCMFRYGGAEKYLVLGYTPSELKEIGDWSSSKMPEIYAERKGITAAQKRWSEDVR